MNATVPTRMANESTVPSPGKITCKPNQDGEISTTPTTAAVTADNVVSTLHYRAIFQCKGHPKRSIKSTG